MSNRRRVLLVLPIVLITLRLASCGGSPTGPHQVDSWMRSFRGSDSNGAYAEAVIPATDGGYVIAGMISPPDASMRSAKQPYLAKFSIDGDSVWARTFGGLIGTATEAAAVIQAPDGGYLAVGTASGSSGGGFDVYAFKVDGQGDSLWTKAYGGINQDLGTSVVGTPDGGYLIAGTSAYDAYFIRIDALGNRVWEKLIETSELEEISSVAGTTDGGFVAVGNTVPLDGGSFRTYLVKIDRSGRLVWTRTIGSTEYDVGYCVTATPDGGQVVVGTTQSFSPSDRDIQLFKTDSTGNKVWARVYGGREDDEGHCVAPTPDGGFIITGYTASSGAGGRDVYLIKTDSSGNETWERTFGGVADDYGLSVACTPDGGYVVAGSAVSSVHGFPGILLLKTDAYGNIHIVR